MSTSGDVAFPTDYTVVMPTFNSAASIEISIRSVLTQTLPCDTLIVVDDGSQDATTDMIRRMATADSRIHLELLSQNSGRPAVPRNVAVRMASTNWIAFLDADDLWHPEKMALQMKALKSCRASFCSAEVRFFEGKPPPWAPLPSQPPLSSVTFGKQLWRYRTPISTVVARREILLRHPFSEDSDYRAREDTECFLRVHERIGSSIKVQVPLLNYRQSAGQISGSKWRMLSRYHLVMRRYRRANGKSFGLMSIVYTASHAITSLWLRRTRNGF